MMTSVNIAVLSLGDDPEVEEGFCFDIDEEGEGLVICDGVSWEDFSVIALFT